MIVVIQCAARKKHDAGHLRRRDGRKVLFVANPICASGEGDLLYTRPDDLADTGFSWRTELLRYNRAPEKNPLGLLPAWQLYQNDTYALLHDKYGSNHLYILSAGWGLISADFLTPYYDITFSRSADRYKHRDAKDRYNDFCMLPTDIAEPVVFFGGKSYVPLFCRLTMHIREKRVMFYNSKEAPDAPSCDLKRYDTARRTNWHYSCVKDFIEGNISI